MQQANKQTLFILQV